ncbi:serpin family protein [Kitasatospora acidiphila]|uniref:Serpin family protein n=1 Tax=Kitasatospora acidiphila TaxID=2567942 RepID=A0A540VYH3_9ACTN|nr:serpin family protein [Kitasatospora acidiphila]TQF01767.1 serpin family protein [Kitasatospora acidiphila]
MRTKRTGWVAGLAALAALLAGCGSSGAPGAGELRAAPVAEAVPTDSELKGTAAGTEAFGLDLYRTVGGQRNMVLSPAGLASALGMALPGARGTTAREMSTVLHTDLPADRYAMALGALTGDQKSGGDGLVLKQSDTAWTQRGYPVSQDYLALLAAAFHAGLYTADFEKDPQGATKAVNALVEQQTGGRIKNLFDPGSLGPGTLLTLTDALYFTAKWQQPFKPEDSADQPFHRLDGSTDTVRMMNQTSRLGYAHGGGGSSGPSWQAVELPYQGGNLAMDLVLPDSGELEAFRKSLSGAALDGMLGALHDTEVELAVPKFGFNSGGSLNEPLAALGMGSAFGPSADFSGLAAPGAKPPTIDQVVQKAMVLVDEKGTTAAAGSGVHMGATAAAPPQVAVHLVLDRPFFFLIRNVQTGQPLFLGQVTDPATN